MDIESKMKKFIKRLLEQRDAATYNWLIIEPGVLPDEVQHEVKSQIAWWDAELEAILKDDK